MCVTQVTVGTYQFVTQSLRGHNALSNVSILILSCLSFTEMNNLRVCFQCIKMAFFEDAQFFIMEYRHSLWGLFSISKDRRRSTFNYCDVCR